VVGLHFFSPANVMKLLEVVRGEDRQGRAGHRDGVAKKIKKTAVVSGVCDGFIGNRMIEQYGRQAGFLLDEGCTPAAGGQGHGEVRLGHGPVPHGRPGRQRHRLGHPQAPRAEKPDMKYSKTADLLCEMGRFGQKTGAGWYDYVPGKRDAIPAEAVEEMIAKHRKSHGITPRKISDEEIVQRLVFALVNEGARILEEGIASKASDIDMVYLTGYGFPLHRGGPMNYADRWACSTWCRHEPLCEEPAGRRRVLAAGAAAGQAGRRRQDLQLSRAGRSSTHE
jgi:3-hydroxyacyl-CoA dehydrogenase